MNTTRTRKPKKTAAHPVEIGGYDTREITARGNDTPQADGYDTRVETPKTRTRVKIGSALGTRSRLIRPGMIPFADVIHATRDVLPLHDCLQ